MLTFSDLVQQILCFFILLLSISKIDVVKLKMFERGWLHRPNLPKQAPVERDNMSVAMMDRIPGARMAADGAVIEGPPGEHLRVERVDEGLKIVFEDSTMFAEGSAELDPSAMGRLKWLIDIGRDKLNYLEVRGFTSSDEADSVNGDHNLLGYLRAASVAKAMVGPEQDPTILPGRLRLSTRGSFDPRVSPENARRAPALQAKNRRVEIIISDQLMDVMPR